MALKPAENLLTMYCLLQTGWWRKDDLAARFGVSGRAIKRYFAVLDHIGVLDVRLGSGGRVLRPGESRQPRLSSGEPWWYSITSEAPCGMVRGVLGHGNVFSDLAARLGALGGPRGRHTSIDLFAGLGGASKGIEDETGYAPIIAINHDLFAIKIHKANHPETKHLHRPILKVNPNKAVGPEVEVDLLWASPDCRHHSRLTGSRKRDAKIRALPWVVPTWVQALRPALVAVENVPGFASWGPLDAAEVAIPHLKGTTFEAWVRSLEALGYTVDHRVLSAADYGAPTARRRLFILGSRDGRPRWPTPTHGPGRAQPWIGTNEIIDWSAKAPSMLDTKIRSEPVKRRIARALERWVLSDPDPLLVVRPDGQLIAPTLIPVGYGERLGQKIRTLDIRLPLGTIVAGGIKHALASFELGGQPHKKLPAFLRKHLGVSEVFVTVRGRRLPVTNIRFRRLLPAELKVAQGLGRDFKIRGSTAEQVRLIGNSVPPQVVSAIIRANR